MAHREQTELETRKEPPVIPHSEPAGGSISLEAAMMMERSRVKRFFKLLGPGLVTGASDDDPSGIGTYAVAVGSLWFGTLLAGLFFLSVLIAAPLSFARVWMCCGLGLWGGVLPAFARNTFF